MTFGFWKFSFIFVGLLLLAIDSPAISMDMGLPARRISIQQFGKVDGEVIVMLHGNGMTSESFQPVLQKLGERFRLVLYDQRGAGKTPYNGMDYSLAAMSTDLESVVQSLKLSKFHLIAHSFGARIAVNYAAKHPKRILSLTIEDMEMQARQSFSRGFCRNLGLEMQALNRVYPNLDSLFEQVSRYYADDTSSISLMQFEYLADGQIRLLNNPYQPYIWGCFADASDLRVSFAKIKSPILILRADPAFSAISEDGLKQMLQAQPRAKVIPFPGSHHIIHLFDPDGFIQALSVLN